MHEVLVNRLGGLGLPRKSVVRLTDRPDMTFDVYRGRKTTTQQQQQINATCSPVCVSVVFYSQLPNVFPQKYIPIDLIAFTRLQEN